ncbi:TPA: CPBP family intramembrane metalloprotease [Staphylococcus aureus]|nr:CPBP family intramembrane metalloprotease [Staphylococcus aureus]SGR31569.1 abortive infection family protein [Staphylococcus aureus]SGT77905.1 abortive infection family protein [Staphylococcus aureus]SGU09672.1 abortive infection family protein [Staphylococcus aureus]HBC8029318.1 CPBP family intramembrane metalloprotease [Staphylococcus aureus]
MNLTIKNKYLFKLCSYLKIDLGAYFLLLLSQVILSMPFLFLNGKLIRLSEKTHHYIDDYWLLAIALLISPVIEEIIFRQYLWKKLLMKRINNIYLTALLSSIIFALAHLSLNFLPFVGNGLVFCWVYHKTNSIINNIFLHFVYNLSLVSLSLLLIN